MSTSKKHNHAILVSARQIHRQPVGWRRLLGRSSGLVLLVAVVSLYSRAATLPDDFQAPPIETMVSQFQSVLNPVNFHRNPIQLLGVVTMVDTNRNLLVLQDDTGAIGLNMDLSDFALEPGQRISLKAREGVPCVESFPKYPYQPSGADVLRSFEIPPNRGNYHLNRLRGFLRPQITGQYTFWVASDNSSELWLSLDDDPANAKPIASIKAGNWVNAREWSRYPSQRSNPIILQAGKSYYIEALHEQVLLNEHLSVAWQRQEGQPSVIDWFNLTPWVESAERLPPSTTNGILWEYWTNYTAGDLAEIVSRGPFKSRLSVRDPQITVLRDASFPKPKLITLDEPLPLEANYRWVEAVGKVSFAAMDGHAASIEITGHSGSARVQALRMSKTAVERIRDQEIRVQGVCEGMLTANGKLMPNVIWVPQSYFIALGPSQRPNPVPAAASDRARGAAAPLSDDFDQTWNSFSSFRGVVTFNDRVLGKDCLYIQNDVSGLFVSQTELILTDLQLGEWVVIGGILQPGKYSPNLTPITVSSLGWRPMPTPLRQTTEALTVTSRDGRWVEMEGVIHSVHTNGTLRLVGNGTRISVWLGRTPAGQLARYLGAAMRFRGVLDLELQDDPLLLVPSPSFVEVKYGADEDPFLAPAAYTTDLTNLSTKTGWLRWMKIEGVVTYQAERSLFVQDSRGGVRVECAETPTVKVGDRVEVVGFPGTGADARTISDAIIRVTGKENPNHPRPVRFNASGPPDCQGMLVHMEASLLAQKNRGSEWLLDVQEGRNFHQVVLQSDLGSLPALEPGSRLGITGVCNFDRSESSNGNESQNRPSLQSIQILMRSPRDIVVLRGPPLWAWKGLALAVGILIAVIGLGSLVIQILRRRLERQRLAKLTFSRQILQSQEEERRRIALNLHDSLGQNLLFIKNQSRMSKLPLTDELAVRNRLDEISEVATQAISEVRKITHNLRPYQLDRLGLTQALRAVINQVSESSQIEFASSVDEVDGLFDKESEIHIYRIIQECLNNIIKHSGATEATVVVKRQASMVHLSVRDNGCGFDATQDRSAGMGLNGITERAWILGGRSKIESSPGGGASLNFEIPILNH